MLCLRRCSRLHLGSYSSSVAALRNSQKLARHFSQLPTSNSSLGPTEQVPGALVNRQFHSSLIRCNTEMESAGQAEQASDGASHESDILETSASHETAPDETGDGANAPAGDMIDFPDLAHGSSQNRILPKSVHHFFSIRNAQYFPGDKKMAHFIKERSGVDVDFLYCRGPRRVVVIYGAVQSAAELSTVVSKMTGCFAGKAKLLCQVEPRHPLQGPLKSSPSPSEPSAKRAKHLHPDIVNLSPEERLMNTVCPYVNIPYEQQLKMKLDSVSVQLKSITSLVMRNTLVPPWLRSQKAKNDGLVCELLDIIPSPQTKGYRIKNEFTVGCGPENDRNPTVGFNLGSFKDGSTAVADPRLCVVVPDRALQVAKAFQVFVRQSSLMYYDPITRMGYWMTVTVKTPQAGGCMATVSIHPQGLSMVEVMAEIDVLAKYFSDGPGKDSGITSMYLHINARRFQATKLPFDEKHFHIFGDTHVYESLLGLKFRISPAAFFQLNNQATERLYSTICDWCNVSERSIVLDICCGTGTIALALAKSVKQVIGIEMEQEAIDDAKFNAELNGIKNAEFICGRAENVVPDLMKRFGRRTELIAVLDPPRAGVHMNVLKAVRRCPALKRIIFVACDLNKSKDNIAWLCKSPNNHVSTQGFRPIHSVVVDMFPQTPHSEVAMLLERVPQAKLSDFAAAEKQAAPTSSTDTPALESDTKSAATAAAAADSI